MFTNHDITPVSSTVELFFSFFFRLCPPNVGVCIGCAEVGGGRGGGGEQAEGGGDQDRDQDKGEEDQERDETLALPHLQREGLHYL